MKDVRGLEIVKYCFKIAIEAISFEPLRWWVEWPALWRITMNSLHNEGVYK